MARRYDQAMLLAQNGWQSALAAGEFGLAARFRLNLGAVEFQRHQFGRALEHYQQALALATRAADRNTAALVSANIASLYSDLGETPAAAEWLQKSIAMVSGTDRAAYLPRMQTQLAATRAYQGRIEEAWPLYRAALDGADQAGDYSLYAIIWSRVGSHHLRAGNRPEAERAFLEAWRICKLHHLPLDGSYLDLGRLRLEQGDLAAAAVLLDRAVERSSQSGGALPTWEAYLARGRVRTAQGNPAGALDDLRVAARLARAFRWATPGDDASQVGAEAALGQVYSALVDAGNHLYQRTSDPALLRETFAAAEENRAASLRALLGGRGPGLAQRPAAWWEATQRLQRAEVEALRQPDAAAEAAVRSASADLVRVEAGTGSSAPPPMPPNLLATARGLLDADTALLAFHSGGRESWLWAVDREGASLYALPAEDQLRDLAAKLGRAVRADAPDMRTTGAQLYRTLFGQLAPRFRARPRWLVALDSGLFDAPLGALVDESSAPDRWLATTHAIQIIPSVSLALAPPPRRRGTGGFVGLADAIYNAADPRYAGGSKRWALFDALPGHGGADPAWTLPRLVGSGAEVRSCAHAWGGEVTLLEGSDANRVRLRGALAGRPMVLHLAAHVLESSRRPTYGMVALSLDPQGRPEVLTPQEVAGWQMEGGLVVLDGCASATGAALPGTGLMGLTRAWLAAGAEHVLATQWPVIDDEGALFRSFYEHLARHPEEGVAGALQMAQRDMIGSGTFRSRPKFWAGYFTVGRCAVSCPLAESGRWVAAGNWQKRPLQ